MSSLLESRESFRALPVCFYSKLFRRLIAGEERCSGSLCSYGRRHTTAAVAFELSELRVGLPGWCEEGKHETGWSPRDMDF
ncbi:hypothetical protein JTE90_018970 [Oedothorax gibbosus]|uniref:Uncharacterized protein n=1 Tax=Oedothorax gibbosus TaxID=931172 RepID=A0AAV6V217_9ARAC|nr:hypothetical protein JTE90_018970 [Oedothorax gibbosus]